MTIPEAGVHLLDALDRLHALHHAGLLEDAPQDLIDDLAAFMHACAKAITHDVAQIEVAAKIEHAMKGLPT